MGLPSSNMRSGRSRRAMSDINVVPYIDVMLVLLVIFMVTAPLVAPSIINLPTVSNASPTQETLPVIVNVNETGNISVRYKDNNDATQEQTLSESQLLQFLSERQQTFPDQPVVIAGDKSVRYEIIMNVMNDLKKNGIKKVGLLVKSSP